MATGTQAPFPPEFMDNNGDPAASHLLYVYTAGTSTKATTYSDVGLTTPVANPLVLDSAGRPGAWFWVPGNSYKVVLAPPNDADPPTAPIWTRDSQQALTQGALTATDTAIVGTAGETLSAGNVCYESDGSGGTTAGRWYKGDSANTYSSTAAGQIGFATAGISSGVTGNILKVGKVTGLSSLTAGATYYIGTAGALVSSAPTNARAVGTADTTTTLVVGAEAGTRHATATVPGVVSAIAQTFAGAKTFSAGIISSVASAFTDTGNPSSFYYPPIIGPGTNGTPVAYVSARINSDSAQRANSGTGETDLSSYSFPANGLNLDGKVVRVTAFGTFAANANNKRVRLYFGATVLIDTGAVAFNALVWTVTAEIMRKSATTQRSTARLFTIQNNTYGTSPGNVISNQSPGETLTGAVTIKSTGQSGTASSDILQEGFMIEIIG